MGWPLQLLFTSFLFGAVFSASRAEIECLNGGIVRPDNSTCDCPIGFAGEQCELQVQLPPQTSVTQNDTADLIVNTDAGDEVQPTEAAKNAATCDKHKEHGEKPIDFVLLILAVLPNLLIPLSCVFAWFISTRECCHRIMIVKPANQQVV